MRPLRLAMEGFGTFREPTEIDFGDIDLVALVGATGSGKSTIIDAVTFALYGCVARYDDDKAVAPVINQTSTRARVRLDFELGGRVHTAVRLVQRVRSGATTKEARLERDGDVLAADAKGMTRAIEELLGLDADQFNRTVVLPQGRFADFLHDKPASRQATLRQLLGLQMYQRVGQAARQRGAAARNQVAAFQPDLDEGEAELTAEHRGKLAARLEAITPVRRAFADDLKAIEDLQRQSDQLELRASTLEASIGLLAAVRIPGELADVDRRRQAATAARDACLAALVDARQRRRDAVAAVAAGPNLVASAVQLGRRRQAVELEAEHLTVTAELVAATETSAAAGLAAAAVTDGQRRLDAAVEHARTIEDEARAAAEAGPNLAQLAAWVQLHGRRDASAAELAAAEDAAAAASAGAEPLVAAAAAAVTAENAAGGQLDEVRQLLGAAAYAGLLVPGEPCPLCHQEVHDLPAHDLDDTLRRTESAFAAARAQRTSAERERNAAQEVHRTASATVTAERKAAAAIEAELSGVAQLDTLREQGQEAQRLRAAVVTAGEVVQRAAGEAAAHRDDPANVAEIEQATRARERTVGLTVKSDDLASRLGRLRAELTDVADEETLERSIAEAERLAAERDRADEAQAMAEGGRDVAVAALEAVEGEVRAAGQQLTAARDGVATLGPPPLAGVSVVADWDALAVWAGVRLADLKAERAKVGEQLTATVERLTRLDREARQRCAIVLAAEATERIELAGLVQHLVVAETEARGALARFDERAAKLAELRARVDGLRQSAEVAEQLGLLLRADGFEGWLMASALEGLVDAASVRLRELSGGQFSFVLDDRTFAVRDHANADEIRSARTLSGGETFLASLSLALALADATAELAPEGAPTIESIFLDEGFGTLDADALDTVAAAIEELGATGRMVGIVTHIRELADRMPVRLEVTKTASGSTVERVEV